MIPHRFRILEAGRTLHIDLPWIRDRREDFIRQSGLSPWPLRFVVTRHGSEDPIQGMVEGDFSFRVDLSDRPGGVYSVHLFALPWSEERDRESVGDESFEADHTKSPADPEQNEWKEFWHQRVFAQPSLRRSPEEIDELARSFAPVLLFSNAEEYFPVDFQTLLASRGILESEESIKVASPFHSESVPVRDLFEYLRYNGHTDILLDQSMFRHEEAFRHIRGAFDRSVVYYSYIEDEDRFFLNFHTFYAFDPKTGVAKMTGVGPHVFDRESLTLVFNEKDEGPASLVLSGHMEGQQILFFESLKMWSTGRVRLTIRDPAAPSVSDHPIVPVAEGSHALYPTSGLYHISVLTELAGHLFSDILSLDRKHSELSHHQVLLPPSLCSEKFVSYDLRPLRLDLLRSEPLPAAPLYDPYTSCLVFSGYWVDVPGPQNERFPPFSRKEEDIADWVDQAYEWSWNDLPDRILRHNAALSAAISEHVRGPGNLSQEN